MSNIISVSSKHRAFSPGTNVLLNLVPLRLCSALIRKKFPALRPRASLVDTKSEATNDAPSPRPLPRVLLDAARSHPTPRVLPDRCRAFSPTAKTRVLPDNGRFAKKHALCPTLLLFPHFCLSEVCSLPGNTTALLAPTDINKANCAVCTAKQLRLARSHNRPVHGVVGTRKSRRF